MRTARSACRRTATTCGAEWGPLPACRAISSARWSTSSLTSIVRLSVAATVALRHALQHHHRPRRQRRHGVQRSPGGRRPQQRARRDACGTSPRGSATRSASASVRRQTAAGGRARMIMHRVGGGGGGGDIASAFGGGAEDKRIRFELFASASNLFNPVNPHRLLGRDDVAVLRPADGGDAGTADRSRGEDGVLNRHARRILFKTSRAIRAFEASSRLP